MEIILAKDIGFCVGVRNAYNISIGVLSQEKSCQMFGQLVHNEKVIQALEARGLNFVFDLKNIKSGDCVIIRAHGEGDRTIKELEKKKVKIVDATCPLVKRAQNFAKSLYKEGFLVIIIGDKGHAEVKAINGVIENKGIIIEKQEDIKKVPLERNLGVVIQTTQNPAEAKALINVLKNKSAQVKVFDTFCPTTSKRQEEIKKIAKKTDLVLIIGSKKSANTQRMIKICKKIKKNVYGIEDVKDIKDEWFRGVLRVGVASGTSAPDWLIQEVVDAIRKIKI